MLISCECLNIIIRLEDSGNEIYNLFVKMKGRNGYLSQGLYKSVPRDKDIKISKLVRVRRSGNVLIHRCLFCGYDIYASSDNSSSEIIFDKEWMIKNDELNNKKRSPKFSPFYKILIDHSELDPDFKFDDNFEEKLSSPARLWLEEQTSVTEKRIEVYTYEQFKELEKLKKHISQDDYIVSKKMLSTSGEIDISGKTALTNKDTSTKPTDVLSVNVHNEKNLEYPLYESDEVFILDDVDMKCSSVGYYVDLLPEETELQNRVSETDFIPSAALMSKSLPLAVPQFISDKDHLHQDVSPDVPVDIAASIKALARSLHGDKIFGDLPPPRFSAL